MSVPFVPRDERTTAVENASYRWAYLFLTYGLLASVAYRGFGLERSSWDVLALVVLSGVITTGYQSVHQVLSWRWACSKSDHAPTYGAGRVGGLPSAYHPWQAGPWLVVYSDDRSARQLYASRQHH